MKLSLGKRLSLINVSNLIIFGLILFVLLNRSLTKQVEEVQTSFSELSLPLSLTLVHGFEQYNKQMEIAAQADLLSMSEEEQVHYLRNILNYVDHTEFIQITDLNGRPLASTREKIILNEGIPLEWRERAFALKFQKTLFSDISKSPFGLNFGFYTATILKDNQGTPKAILTSFLSQTWLQSEIGELEDLLKSKELPHINITLFNQHGIVLASNFNREVGAPFARFEHYKNTSGLNQDVALLEGLNKLNPELLPEGHELFIATSAKSEKFLESVESIKKQLSLISFGAIILAALVSIFYSRRLSRKLQNISGQVHTGSEQIGTVSGDIQKQAKALSEASEEQASALEETVASLNEINAMVEKNAENTENSKQLSSMTQKAAAVGKGAVSEMIDSIADVEKSNNEMGNRMNQKSQELTEIVTMIQEIESKTKIINDIVFQTKLLSFNASVEAARAGEHGKGFAVVAQEIGALAQSSGKAAQEIETLLTSSVGKVESIVSQIKTTVTDLVRTGAQNVSKSQNVAKECQEKLDDILLHSTKLDSAVEEISLASREQAQGIQEISTAMEHLDQVIKKNVQISHSLEGGVDKIFLQSKDFEESSADLNELIHGTTKKKTKANVEIPKKTENEKKQLTLIKNTPSKNTATVAKSPSIAASQPLKKTVPVEQVPSSDSDQWEDI